MHVVTIKARMINVLFISCTHSFIAFIVAASACPMLHAPWPLATMFAMWNSLFMWLRVGGATLMYPIVSLSHGATVRRFVWLRAAVKDLSASWWCLRPREEEEVEDKDEYEEIEELSVLAMASLTTIRTLNVSGISICLRIRICIRICTSSCSCSCICEVNKPIRLT